MEKATRLREFAGVLDQIETTYAGREYENLKKVAELATEVQSGKKAATLLVAIYGFSIRDKHPSQRGSYALLTGFRNRFLKLRYTLAADLENTPERGQSELKQLVTALLRTNKQQADDFWDAVGSNEEKKIPSEDAVKGAIRDLQADPLGAVRRGAAKKIVGYAETSTSVTISLSKKALPWLNGGEVDERRSALLAAYVAGNTESQIRRGQKDDDPVAGVLQEIATYRQLQQAEPSLRLDGVEELITLEREGRLKEYLTTK